MKHPNREAWLEAAVELMTPLFQKHGYKVPKVRVACGWPSRGGLAAKKRTIGQCWDKSAAKDKVNQIFISPWLDAEVSDPCGVLPVLIHEVIHAVVGIKEKHNKVFGKCAREMGLEGKLTCTVASEGLISRCKVWEKQLGDYPHSQLDSTKSPVKKQSTRLMKCECGECGYVCRTTKKWIVDVGAPHCPKHGEMTVDIPAEIEEGDDE
jgi:hypothetical protein